MATTSVTVAPAEQSMSVLRFSVRCNNSEIKCGTCSKSFRTRRDYNRHRKMHEKPYKCGLCVDKFALKSDLDRHQAKHDASSERFNCAWPNCSFKGAVGKDNLLRHIKNAHSKKEHSHAGANDKQKILIDVSIIYQKSIENEKYIMVQRAKRIEMQISLFHGVAAGDQDVVLNLLENGADIEALDEHKRTPLLLACELGRYDIAEMLIEKGADLDVWDDQDCTPLISAYVKGHIALAQLLIEKGADCDTVTKKRGVNIDTKDTWKTTPLAWAARFGKDAMVEYLLGQGADVDTKDIWGRTPLSYAAMNGHAAVVTSLLAAGANMDARCAMGRMPLWYALKWGQSFVVSVLRFESFVRSNPGLGQARGSPALQPVPDCLALPKQTPL